MKHKISNALYFVAAMFVSNIVYIIDAMSNAAFAEVVGEVCRRTQFGTSTIASWFATNLGSCDTRCKSMYGHSLFGSINRYDQSNPCYCLFTGTITVSFSAMTETQQCGEVYWCGSGSTAYVYSAECNTSGWAGYLQIYGIRGTSASCACCPGAGTGGQIGSYMPSGEAPWNVVQSRPNAMAASECYLQGMVSDPSGLFEYTDSNVCYYES